VRRLRRFRIKAVGIPLAGIGFRGHERAHHDARYNAQLSSQEGTMASSYLACRYIRRGARNSGRVRDRLTRICSATEIWGEMEYERWGVGLFKLPFNCNIAFNLLAVLLVNNNSQRFRITL